MKLPISLPFQKKDDTEYYLSLLLSDEKAHATVFAEKNGSIEIIGEHEQHFPHSIEKLSDEQLLTNLDRVISTAESKLPDGYQTKKTVFGVKENWIDDTKITKEYLAKLKKVCDGLGLTPIGFLVIHEAIAHLLQKEEGAPVSAILCEVGTDTLAISILRAGKILETKRIPIQQTIPHTIDKTLQTLTDYEILPSRIIIFNEKAPEKLSHELTAHQWSKSLPFLHVPQITMLPKHFESKAILFGAASQMGFEVVDKFDMPIIPDTASTLSAEKNIPSAGEMEATEEAAFGFVSDKDIAKMTDTSKLADIDDPIDTRESEEIETYNQEFFASEHELIPPSPGKQQSKWQTKLHHLWKTIKKQTAGLGTMIPVEKITHRFPILAKRKGIVFIPPIVIAVLLLFFLLYIFTLRATVVVYVDPKTIQEEQDVILSTDQSTDVTQGIIAVEQVSTTLEGEVSTATTGKKEIGEKAKGGITILSSLTKEQTIPKGTTITASNGLTFTLDNDVKIASSSGVSDIKNVSGSITATANGKEYNLPSGTKFSVGGFDKSSVEGKNNDAFSGGSKKEITVVAKADTAKLVEALPKKLTEQARKDLQAKVGNTSELLPLFLSTSVDKETFSKDIGEEAASVDLNGSVVFTSGSYHKNDLQKLAEAVLSQDNTELQPAKESISFSLKDINEDTSGDISAKAIIKGYLLPKIEKEQIQQSLAGKSFAEAETTVMELPQVQKVEISLQPPLPFLPAFLPRIANNITIDIQTNE